MFLRKEIQPNLTGGLSAMVLQIFKYQNDEAIHIQRPNKLLSLIFARAETTSS